MIPRALRRLAGSEPLVMIALGALLGVGTGYGAIACRSGIDLVRQVAFGSTGDISDLARVAPWWLVLALPAIGGVIVAPMVFLWAQEARGHGVPEVMEAIARRDGRIRPRVAVVKALASIVTIGTGGSVGWEGPIVQIGAGLGSTVGQALQVARRRMRVLVACGAAAGIAATFNAPIAGVLFSLEIFLGDLALSLFAPVVVAAVSATAVSYAHFGPHAAFALPHGVYRMESVAEIPLYAILGAACACGAVLFTRVLYRLEEIGARVRVPALCKPALGGLALGAIGIAVPEALGVGYTTMERAMDGAFPLGVLAGLFAVKLAATCITLASGGSGGVFAPSLVLGALLGGVFGSLAHGLFPSMTAVPGVYAVVGMAAFVAATMHAPISSILILFEMTNDYGIMLPLMIACVIATTAARGMFPESIYTLKLKRRGITFRGGRDVALLQSLSVRDNMDDEPVLLTPDLPFHEVRSRVLDSTQHVFPVVDAEQRLAGIVTLDELRRFLFEEGLRDVAVASDFARPCRDALSPADDLDRARERFAKAQLDELPVIEPATNRVVGLMREADLRTAYNRELG